LSRVPGLRLLGIDPYHDKDPEQFDDVKAAYMKAAAGFEPSADVLAKGTAPPPPMVDQVGPLAQAESEKSEARKNVERENVAVAETNAQLEVAEKEMQQEKGIDGAAKAEKRVTALKAALTKATNSQTAAKATLENEKMAVEEAKVTAGKEDPTEAVDKIKADKEAQAQEKLKLAKDQTEQLASQKNEYMAKRTEAMQTEEKMKKIEKDSDSPAVKGAAQEMEEKEEGDELDDLEEAQAAEQKMRLAEQKQKKEQEEEGEGRVGRIS